MKHPLAGLFAATAGLSTDAAVLVHSCMALAFLCTCPAGFHARFHHFSDDSRSAFREPGHDIPGRGADFCAVDIESDTAHQLLDAALSKAGVGARIATLGAVIAGVDAFPHALEIDGGRLGMGLKHFGDVGHSTLLRQVAGETGYPL